MLSFWRILCRGKCPRIAKPTHGWETYVMANSLGFDRELCAQRVYEQPARSA